MKKTVQTLGLYFSFALLNFALFFVKPFFSDWDIILIFISLLTFFFGFLSGLFSRNNKNFSTQTKKVSIHLILLALLTAVGTFVQPEAPYTFWDIHRSPFYCMFASYLIGTLTVYILLHSFIYTGLKRFGLMLSHLGLLFIFSGSLYSLVFRIEGIINLKEAEETSFFERTIKGDPVGFFYPLSANIRLNKFTVKKTDPEANLTLYKKGKLQKEISLNERSFPYTFFVNDIEITLLRYIPNTQEITHIKKDPFNTAQTSVLSFTFDSQEKVHHLIATPFEDGFIRHQNGMERLIFTQKPISLSLHKKETLYIDAKTRFLTDQSTQYKIISYPFKVSLNTENTIFIQDIIPHAYVTHERIQNKKMPFNPMLYARIQDKNVWMSPYDQTLTSIGSGYGMHLTLKPPKITSFQSDLSIKKGKDQTWTPFILEVNSPLSLQNCKIYQGRYNKKDETVSGLNITCDSGRISVKIGIWITLIGMFILTLYRKLLRGKYNSAKSID